MEPPVQLVDLCGQVRDRPLHIDAVHDLVDGNGSHRWRGDAHAVEPLSQLLRRVHVDDAPETDPAMRGRAHRTVLPGREHRRLGALLEAHVLGRPSRQRELGVSRAVTRRRNAIVVLGQRGPVPTYEHRAERFVTRRKRPLGELDAAPKMPPLGLGQLGGGHA